jgi:hypothetical protein
VTRGVRVEVEVEAAEEVPLVFDAVSVIVYVFEDANPVIVYGEPLENVAVTVDPDVGTAVTVLDVVKLSFVKEIVTVVVVVPVTERLVGALGTVINNASVDFSSRSKSATI